MKLKGGSKQEEIRQEEGTTGKKTKRTRKGDTAGKRRVTRKKAGRG